MKPTAVRFAVAVTVFAAALSSAFAQELRNWGHSGATEVLNCPAGFSTVDMGAAAVVEINFETSEQYVCNPTLPALTPGQRVHFGLLITSSGVMNNPVLLLGVEFEYLASSDRRESAHTQTGG